MMDKEPGAEDEVEERFRFHPNADLWIIYFKDRLMDLKKNCQAQDSTLILSFKTSSAKPKSLATSVFINHSSTFQPQFKPNQTNKHRVNYDNVSGLQIGQHSDSDRWTESS